MWHRTPSVVVARIYSFSLAVVSCPVHRPPNISQNGSSVVYVAPSEVKNFRMATSR
ncbi:hypothetical protein BD310DRAFT_934386 [Dichomitus squalens]|uniref:Uncharacterized protein n=1 Tax=Dichomitus squalens TaxID=114155 RepID=A0A4Q9PLR9_9APHY|nr:hypothetical protein BD310DRAFT_934386 [Dichomitus squalens]